jgi:hypothetical protein
MRKTLIGLALSVLLPSAAFAKDNAAWRASHPRRAEVNDRLKNQNERIREGRENGTLSKQQAQQLHAEDHNIRTQEREMAAQNGGHVTKTEQRALNQEENRSSQQIRNEKHGQ